MGFKPNRNFKKDYDRIFRQSPEGANLLLLMCELADHKGRVKASDEEVARLMTERFDDPRGYQL